MHGFLADISIAIIAASAMGILFHLLKQPVIIGYLLAGIIIGPNIGPQLLSSPENIDMISETGIVLLLFLVGLEMNPGKTSRYGKGVLVPGIGQFALSFAVGIPFFILVGMAQGFLQGAYLSAACALSSTAIVLKSLYESKESDTLHGRASVGILVVQDLWALIMLTVLPGIGSGGVLSAGIIIVKTLILFAVAFLASRFILKHVVARLVRSPEMTVITSIGWCTAIAGLAGKAGLSPALGALAAGLSISIFPYHIFVTDKMEPLRDLFLMLFFVSLGLKIPLPDSSLMIHLALIIGFVLVSRVAAVYPLVRLSGGSSRTAFISSCNLSQISEFSLVILALGVSLGQVTGPLMSSMLYAMTITAVASSYMIKYNHRIHYFFSKFFTSSDPQASKKETGASRDFPIIILGLHRGSQYLIEMIAKKMPMLLTQILVIDYNIEAVTKLRSIGVEGYLGDISRTDVLEKAGVTRAHIIIATIPPMLLKGTSISRLVELCRGLAPHAEIIASADFKSQIAEMKDAGASRIIMPYYIAGEECADIVISLSGRIPE